VVVPYGDPRELLVREKEVEVGAVGCKTAPVVIQGEDFSFWLNGAGGGRSCVFVDVVAELNRGQPFEPYSIEPRAEPRGTEWREISY
jgi:hypothetical protein